MRESKCPSCNHYSLYRMPEAGKTICANAQCKAQFDTVKLGKVVTSKAAN